MIYPSTSQYIESLRLPKQYFKSRALRRIELCLDMNAEPIYSSSSNTTAFEIMLSGRRYLLRVFLNAMSEANYLIKEDAERYTSELTVVTSQGVGCYDVVIEDISDRVLSGVIGFAPIEVREYKVSYFEGGKWGFKDIWGNIIVRAKYDSVELFYEGRAVVFSGGKYGLIDSSGVEVIPLEYDELSYDHSYYCTVEREGLFGVIDRQGLVVVPLEWDWVGDFAQRRVLVCRDDKYGYLDNHSRRVTDLIYDDATSFNSEGFARVRIATRTFLINTTGDRIA